MMTHVFSRQSVQRERISGASVKNDKRGNDRRVAKDKALAAVGIKRGSGAGEEGPADWKQRARVPLKK